MTVKILTDSACDLPLHFLKKQQISMFPLRVHVDGQEYDDLETIEPKKIFAAIRSGQTPKTSQVSPQRFKEQFTKFAKEKHSCIYIAFSSELSGTYQTAMMIRSEVMEEFPDFQLTIINSKCASLGLGLVVAHAAELSEKGMTYDEIVQSATNHCNHMEHLFTVDDLDYLAQGGRVSKTSAFVGGLLNIKPILDVEDGKLIPRERVRGRKKVLKRILEMMEERGTDLENQTIAISHGDDEDTALQLKETIEQKFGCKTFIVNTIGAVIGSHAGPGTLAVFFLNELIDR